MTLTSRLLLTVEQGPLPLTVARAAGTGAAVVIVPSAFGVTPDLEAQMTELAAVASVVVALDPFFREDPGPALYGDMNRVMGRMQAMDRQRAHGDLRAAIDWTRNQPGVGAVVVLGICFGGLYALEAAADGTANGVVTWHGTRMDAALGRAGQMRCPMRLHFGSVDPFVSADAVEAVRGALAGKEDVQVIVHEGATHGFSHRTAPAFDETAERAGMESVKELSRKVR